MQKLIQGLHHFQANVFSTQRPLFEHLAEEGQNPTALFITCSDSRVSPELITQAAPGELFILKNAGNIVPPYGTINGGTVATIEFAVAALKVRHIILCGHSHCGAMKALANPEMLVDLPATTTWLSFAESTRRIMKENYSHLEGSAFLTATVEENVLVQMENLRTHPTVASALKRNEMTLHGWVYKFETGEVFAYDPAQGQFITLSAVAAGLEGSLA